MKYFTLILILIQIPIVQVVDAQRYGHAYGKSHHYSNDKQHYRILIHNVSVQNIEQRRFHLAKDYIKNHTLTTIELRKLLRYFELDQNKVLLAKRSFYNVTDNQNYNLLLPAIYSDHYKNELRRFISDKVRSTHLTFPAYFYPNPFDYKGPLGRPNFINDYAFNNLALDVSKLKNNQNRSGYISNLSSSYNLSVCQLMKLLTFITNPAVRYDLCLNLRHNVYDLRNYNHMNQLFSGTQFKSKFDRNFSNNESRSYHNHRIHFVSNAEFQRIMFELKSENFNKRRLELAKTIIHSKAAFSVQQISHIMALFNFDSYKLSIAKFAFIYTIDIENYYQLKNSLTFSSNRNELLQFIRNNS